MLNHKFGRAKHLNSLILGVFFKEKSPPLYKKSTVQPLFEEIKFQITQSLIKIHYYNSIQFI